MNQLKGHTQKVQACQNLAAVDGDGIGVNLHDVSSLCGGGERVMSSPALQSRD
jgi:hypothetical protein